MKNCPEEDDRGKCREEVREDGRRRGGEIGEHEGERHGEEQEEDELELVQLGGEDELDWAGSGRMGYAPTRRAGSTRSLTGPWLVW